MKANRNVGSIARAARVLEVLASAPAGCGLSELIERTAFTKTTAHRVLASLREVRYVSQDPETRVYSFGIELAALAHYADQTNLGSLAERGMNRLADLTGDTIFLSVPEGAASVCVARKVGSFPIRTLTLDRGDRRPLGIGAGSLALYCAMPAGRRAAIGRVNANWLLEYRSSPAALEALEAETEDRGYALNSGGVVPGMSAVGLPIITASGRLVAAIAIGAINDRMTQERIETVLIPALRNEANRLSADIPQIASKSMETVPSK